MVGWVSVGTPDASSPVARCGRVVAFLDYAGHFHARWRKIDPVPCETGLLFDGTIHRTGALWEAHGSRPAVWPMTMPSGKGGRKTTRGCRILKCTIRGIFAGSHRETLGRTMLGLTLSARSRTPSSTSLRPKMRPLQRARTLPTREGRFLAA